MFQLRTLNSNGVANSYFSLRIVAARMERFHPVVNYVMVIATMVVLVSWTQRPIYLSVCEYAAVTSNH